MGYFDTLTLWMRLAKWTEIQSCHRGSRRPLTKGRPYFLESLSTFDYFKCFDVMNLSKFKAMAADFILIKLTSGMLVLLSRQFIQ